MAIPLSPLAPSTYPELPDVAGVRFATAEAGIKYRNRTDVLLVSMDE
ncbi:MAG: N-acetylglutamate synthase, partial [Devosia sp.]|nr:N-acetylglutamate synthase [Devosia sp.]